MIERIDVRRDFAIVFVLVAVVALLAGCGGDSPATTVVQTTVVQTTVVQTTVVQTTVVQTTVPDAASEVLIDDFAFDPASKQVPIGATITWTNAQGVAHTTTSADGSWDSGALRKGESFTFTAVQAGTFAYSCSIHPSMRGSIEVTG